MPCSAKSTEHPDEVASDSEVRVLIITGSKAKAGQS